MYQVATILTLTCLIAQAAAAAEVYCRYRQNGEVFYGQVEGELIHQLSRAPWDGGVKTGETVKPADVELLHPSEPQKVIGIGGSYKDSWKEGQTPYNTIRWFSKTPTSAASPGETVELPASLDTLMAETELVAVIGKRVKNASPAEAKEAIFGYTIGNDLVGDATSYHRINGESDDQPEPLFPSALKMGDRFSPYGPFIYTGIDWRNRKRTLRITNEKTGKEIVYEHNTSNMMVPPEKIVSDLSRVFSLNPGDVIFTGTTAAFPAQAGDVMEVSVEGLGTITNQVVATPKP